MAAQNKQVSFSQVQNNQKKASKEASSRTLKTLLVWQAPERLFKRREREYFTTIGAIVFLLTVILFFLKEWLLIAVMVALTFVAYVMATKEPELIEHRITNRGITTGGKDYSWDGLKKFWFSQKWDQKVLHVETSLRFPRQLILLLGDANQEEIKKILSQHLRFEEPEKTWVDQASEWLVQRIPLEKVD